MLILSLPRPCSPRFYDCQEHPYLLHESNRNLNNVMGYEIGIIGFSSVPSEPQFANFCQFFFADVSEKIFSVPSVDFLPMPIFSTLCSI